MAQSPSSTSPTTRRGRPAARPADPARQADGGANKVAPEPGGAESLTNSRTASEPAKPADLPRVAQEKARLDTNRSAQARDVNLIGPSVARYEGRGKVTGSLKYAADVPVRGAAYAYMIHAPVARGRITRADMAAARAVPGVLRVYTHEDMAGRLKPAKFVGQGGTSSTDHLSLSSPEIIHEGQIIGMVVAESYEAARHAAHLARFDIAATAPSATFDDPGLRVRPLTALNPNYKNPVVGDAPAAYAAAPVKHEASYSTPAQHHNPIELYSTTAMWEGGRLTLHEPSAGVLVLKNGVATQLGIRPDQIDVVSPFVGGSFGSKVTMTPRTAIVALAARDLGQPVKCVLTREQGFTQATHRAETRHDIKLSCDARGKLASYDHEASELTSRTDAYTVNGTDNSVHMYAWPTIRTAVNVVEADRNTPGFMRSPPEVPYIFALECAMDELAEKAGVDPVQFRKINDAQVSSYEGKAYTSRNLIACLDQGAAAFGWSRRDPRPGSMRDGDWQIGYGVAMATYPTVFSAISVRIRLTPDGAGMVQTGTHDIGTGVYAVAALTAAQELGLDVAKMRVEMGDSRMPPGPVAGGSNTTASLCNAIASACHNIRNKLGVTDGQSVREALRSSGAIEEYLEYTPAGAQPGGVAALAKGQLQFAGGTQGDKLRFAFGAEFVEVRVHARTREVRVPRITGAFAAGRIVNARAARSQLLGGMIWGIGSALHEATEIDRRSAKYVNDNIAEYLMPVNADIPAVEIIMIPEDDTETNPLGIKGVGELANVGTAAAVCNAVYHATGKRIRDLPIRIEQLV